ncbi:hypothetical protein LSTR_LSTR005255 [Laodelphax striatellus]|uniref:Remodeling and spacing factor 1 n=1 Tax=Laodelphax striatellus TaxID=195883 RepID=A0A482X7U3_LAOST|nr:hypothetical protein LSTR_LSTR005255 [Laodelphax striatellus]
MASENEASRQSCASDPNFAVICSFLERFAEQCGIPYPAFSDLQEMIENTEQVSQSLIDLHIKLLRKARKTFSTEKWERTLVRFCQPYSPSDAWDLERYGYMNTKVDVRLRLLKILLDAQFDYNLKFKTDINKLDASELRSEPLGRDKLGCNYWCQLDPTANIRVYKEDQEEETWELVAKDREGLVSLITNLSAGENIEGLEEFLNEDSNSQDLEMNPVLDTGQDADSLDENDDPGILKNGINSKNEEDKSEVSDIKECVEPKLMKTVEEGDDKSKPSKDIVKEESIPDEDKSKPSKDIVKEESIPDEDKPKVLASQNPVPESDNEGSSVVKLEEVKKENKEALETPSETKTATKSDDIPKLKPVKGEIEPSSTTQKSASNVSAAMDKVEDSNVGSESHKEIDQESSHQTSLKEIETGKVTKEKNSKVGENENRTEKISTEAECIDKEEKTKNESCVSQKSSKKDQRAGDELVETVKEQKNSRQKDKPDNTTDNSTDSDKLKFIREAKPTVKPTPGRPQSNTTSTVEKVPEKGDEKTEEPVAVHKDSEPSSRESIKSAMKTVENRKEPKDEFMNKPVEISKLESSSKLLLDKTDSNYSKIDKSGIDSKPALNLSKEPTGFPLKDVMQSKLSKTLVKAMHSVPKEVDLSPQSSLITASSTSSRMPSKNVLDVTEELKQRSALLKSGPSAFKGKDGKSAPGSKLDEIFKLKRSMTSLPESQPLPAHFIGTSKNLLLEKMRMNSMNDTLNLTRYTDSGKFTQPPSNVPYISKDVEDLSMGSLKRPCPEDLSVYSSKKAHVEDRKLEPMVSEAIEEPIMLVKGEGSGRDCETGNVEYFYDYQEETDNKEELEFIVSDAIEEPVMFVIGEGSGRDCETGNVDKENANVEKEKNMNATEMSAVDKIETNSVDDPNDSDSVLKKEDSTSICRKESVTETTTSDSALSSEKKSPKLWSIDTICSSEKDISSENSDSIKPSSSNKKISEEKDDKNVEYTSIKYSVSSEKDRETKEINPKEQLSISCQEDIKEAPEVSCLVKPINENDENEKSSEMKGSSKKVDEVKVQENISGKEVVHSKKEDNQTHKESNDTTAISSEKDEKETTATSSEKDEKEIQVESNLKKQTASSKDFKETPKEKILVESAKSSSMKPSELSEDGKESPAEINLKKPVSCKDVNKGTKDNISIEKCVDSISSESGISENPSKTLIKDKKDVEVKEHISDGKNTVIDEKNDDSVMSKLKAENLKESEDVTVTVDGKIGSTIDKNELETATQSQSLPVDDLKSCEIKIDDKNGNEEKKESKESKITCSKSSEKQESNPSYGLKQSHEAVENLADSGKTEVVDNKAVDIKSLESKPSSVNMEDKCEKISNLSSNVEDATQKDSRSVDASKETTKHVNNICIDNSLLKKAEPSNEEVTNKPSYNVELSKSIETSESEKLKETSNNSDLPVEKGNAEKGTPLRVGSLEMKSESEKTGNKNSLTKKGYADTSSIDNPTQSKIVSSNEKEKTDEDSFKDKLVSSDMKSSESDKIQVASKKDLSSEKESTVTKEKEVASDKTTLKDKSVCKVNESKADSSAINAKKSTINVSLEIDDGNSKRDSIQLEKNSTLKNIEKKTEEIGAAKVEESLKENKTIARKEPLLVDDKKLTSSHSAKENVETKKVEEPISQVSCDVTSESW